MRLTRPDYCSNSYISIVHDLKQYGCPTSYDKTALDLNRILGASTSSGLVYNLKYNTIIIYIFIVYRYTQQFLLVLIWTDMSGVCENPWRSRDFSIQTVYRVMTFF